MRAPTIAAGICTWQDGPALENCLESIRPHVDHIYTADGAFAGFDTKGIPTGHVWAKQSLKRDALLQACRAGGYDWLLQIDADEQLHRGDQLRYWLNDWPDDCFPLGFYFEGDRGGGVIQPALWKLIRVRAFRRVVSQGAYLEHANGQTYVLFWELDDDQRIDLAARPYLTHHPELRPPVRREMRFNELEGLIEPPPRGVPTWPLRSLAPTPVTRYSPEMFYCPSCGLRYAGPGVCKHQHPPEELAPLPEHFPPADGTTAGVDPADGSEPAPADQQA